MYSLTDICFLCLVHTKSLTSTLSEDEDGIVLEEKLKCFLMEYVHFKPEMIKYVCTTCFGNVNNLYSFRQQSLRNMTTLNDYFDKLAIEAPPYKQFLEVKPDNQTIFEDLSIKLETKHELKCEEIDIEDTDPPNEDSIQHKPLEVNIVVKSEPRDSFEDESINDDTIENFELSEDNGGDEEFVNESESTSKSGTKNTDKKSHKCNECHNSFTCRSHLIRHVLCHTGEKPFKCDLCDRTFTQKSYLEDHRRCHTGEKPYKCDICDKTFSQRSGLFQHKRSHARETHKCEMCDKAFIKKFDLVKHIRGHTGEKPYKCDLCDKTFSQRSGLFLHKRSHTGETPYKCEMCDKAFIKKNDLDKHIRCHTGEKPYKCDVCDKAFNQKSSLVRHIRLYTGKNSSKCAVKAHCTT